MKKKQIALTNEKKYLYTIFFSFLLLIVLGVVLYYEYRIKEQIPQELLQVSQPVYKLIGEVVSVSRSTVTISFKNRELTPTPGKQLKLSFAIDNNTEITTSELPIPLYIHTDRPKTPKLTIRNLEKGQLVEVVSKDDLRTAKSWNLSATHINILNVTNMLHGIVTANEKNKLFIKGYPVPNPSAVSYLPKTQEQNYTVLIDSDTEISFKPSVPPPANPLIPPVEPKPLQYTSSDLVPNTEVTVYVSGNVTEQTPLQAHMIIPYFK